MLTQERQDTNLTVQNKNNKWYLSFALFIISAVSLIYCGVSLEWTPVELILAVIGLAVLWLPIGATVYLLLPEKFPDNLSRFTFSAIASYCLTTLLYFGFSTLGVDWLFYVTLVMVSSGNIIYIVRKKKLEQIVKYKVNLRRVDWILIALISVSLATNLSYQNPYKVSSENGDRHFLLSGELTYFSGLSYELARHTPPVQQANEAGLAERAYHMFPHLTLMLINRFTLQTDMLHSQLAYHYTVIEILFCLVIYCLVKNLCGSKWGGYMGMSLLYLLAVSNRPLKYNSLNYYYFTLDPHVSSGLQGSVLTSPQMYSGILVLQGVFLGVFALGRLFYKRQRVGALAIILALMVGAMLRFRVQIFIPLLPGFLLLLSYGWFKRRQTVYVAAIGVAMLTTILLYLEMQSSVYLADTAKIRFGYNYLTSPDSGSNWLNSWPLSGHVYEWLHKLLSDSAAFTWSWQVISISGFVIFNMLSLPALLALFFYLRSKTAYKEPLFFSVLVVWVLIVATFGAMVITTNYDNYSVGGQMLLHTYWYAFPLLGVLAWRLYQFLQKRLHWRKVVWGWVGFGIIVFALGFQQYNGPSELQKEIRQNGVTLSSNEWNTLSYLHNNTPASSIIISNQYLNPGFSIFAGIAGRAAYFSYLDDGGVSSAFEDGDRKQFILELWSTKSSEQFCNLLKPTVATHLVEYSKQPLSVQNPACLQQVWSSAVSSEKATVWQIKR